MISDEQFAAVVEQAMAELPPAYLKNMKNVAVVYEDLPTEEQRHKLQLRGDQTLFGLYEGIPLTKRGAGYNLVLPDKITIFKQPLLAVSRDLNDLKEHVKRTVWHEIAHHYGLGHDRIDELQYRHRPKPE